MNKFNMKVLLRAVRTKITLSGLALATLIGALYLVYLGETDSLQFWSLFVSFAILTILFIISLFVKGNKDERRDSNTLANSNNSDIVMADVNRSNNYEIDADLKRLLSFIKNNNYTYDKTIRTLESISNRIPLIEHDLFTTGYIECIDRIDKAKRKLSPNSSNIRKSIPEYLKFVIERLVENHRNYIIEHQNIIYDETVKISIKLYLKEFLVKRNEIKEQGRKIGYSHKLIDKFSELIEPAISKFKSSVMRVKNSSIAYNDYMRFYVIFDALMTLCEWITIDYIDELLNMNGELEL